MASKIGQPAVSRIAICLTLAGLAAPAFAGRTVDRLYLFGDDARENASDGLDLDNVVPDAPFNSGSTIDSAGVLGAQQIVNLSPAFASFGPNYVEVTDRPDFGPGETGLAVTFAGGSSFEHLLGNRFGTPSTSISSNDPDAGGDLDYRFITDRGMQFWTKPGATPTSGDPADDAHIVMDTNNHGALINANGRYTMRYASEDYEGAGAEAVANVDEWAHIMVVRPDSSNPYSAMYVDGVAVAAAPGGYSNDIPAGGGVNDRPDTAPLVVGAATFPASSFSQGFENNYIGIVDDLEMFVLGLGPGGDRGEFDFVTDNAYAAEFGPDMPVDLVNDDGAVTMDDIDVFVDNWLFEKRVNGVLLGDLETVAVGDFNYSGRVDIEDWELLNVANPQLAALAMAQIAAIPEPAAAMITVSALCVLLRRRV